MKGQVKQLNSSSSAGHKTKLSNSSSRNKYGEYSTMDSERTKSLNKKLSDIQNCLTARQNIDKITG